MTLDQVSVGTNVTVVSMTFDEELTRRINALGIRINLSLTVIRKGPFNGPIHVVAGTTELMLRVAQAKLITVV